MLKIDSNAVLHLKRDGDIMDNCFNAKQVFFDWSVQINN